MAWVSRITTVGLEMVLPGLAGVYLDRKLGTSFLTLIGFGLGLVVGMTHLLLMTAWSEQEDSSEQRRNK